VSTSESKELFFTLLPEQRLAIRQNLLQSLNGESVSNVRNQIGDAIAEIARQYSDHGMKLFEHLGDISKVRGANMIPRSRD
jgi:CHAD domain-containing protein